MVKLVNTADLKSAAPKGLTGSSPVSPTKIQGRIDSKRLEN